MRVVHISKVTGISGSEGHLLRLLPGMAARGVEVSMVVLEDPRYPCPAFCQALEAHHIEVTRLPIRGHLDPGLRGCLVHHLRAHRPDLVHTHLLHADLYGLHAARRAKVPYAISSRHNNDAFRHNAVIKWLNRRAMRQVDRVITISQALEHFVREVEGIGPEKIVTVYYGLEAPPSKGDRLAARETLGERAEVPLVGFFGRLVGQKGVDVLLDAFPSVRAAHPEARLVIVGDGPLRADLERRVRTLGMAGAVNFAGWRGAARDIMPACDLIAVPSRWEGFGLVTLEAMGYAIPLVASRTSALPEIVVDGETGILVPPEDPPALAEAICALLSDPPWAAALGRAGYERLVRTFSVEAMIEATLEVYAAVTNVPLKASS